MLLESVSLHPGRDDHVLVHESAQEWRDTEDPLAGSRSTMEISGDLEPLAPDAEPQSNPT